MKDLLFSGLKVGSVSLYIAKLLSSQMVLLLLSGETTAGVFSYDPSVTTLGPTLILFSRESLTTRTKLLSMDGLNQQFMIAPNKTKTTSTQESGVLPLLLVESGGQHLSVAFVSLGCSDAVRKAGAGPDYGVGGIDSLRLGTLGFLVFPEIPVLVPFHVSSVEQEDVVIGGLFGECGVVSVGLDHGGHRRGYCWANVSLEVLEKIGGHLENLFAAVFPVLEVYHGGGVGETGHLEGCHRTGRKPATGETFLLEVDDFVSGL